MSCVDELDLEIAERANGRMNEETSIKIERVGGNQDDDEIQPGQSINLMRTMKDMQDDDNQEQDEDGGDDNQEQDDNQGEEQLDVDEDEDEEQLCDGDGDGDGDDDEGEEEERGDFPVISQDALWLMQLHGLCQKHDPRAMGIHQYDPRTKVFFRGKHRAAFIKIASCKNNYAFHRKQQHSLGRYYRKKRSTKTHLRRISSAKSSRALMVRGSSCETLDLSNSGLVYLPRWVGEMTSMHLLNVSFNNLKRVPRLVMHLTTLVALDLSNNTIRSPSPMQILSNLMHLHTLDLSNNELQSLHLDHGPADLIWPPQLHTLDVSHNRLSVISWPSHLHTLRGSHNFIVKVVLNSKLIYSSESDESTRFHLHTLDLSHNRLSTLPVDFSRSAPHLHTLDLSNNQLTHLPADFARCTATLRVFRMNNNHLRIADLPRNQIHTLDFSDNKISAITPNHLRILSHGFLRSFNLSGNLLTGLIPSIAVLSKSLRVLSLARNRIHQLPEAFTALRLLSSLDASENRFSVIPEPLFSLPLLAHLDLSRNYITGFPDSFHQNGSMIFYPQPIWSALESIHLGHNTITFIPGGLFQSCVSLSHLDMSSNKLHRSTLSSQISIIATLTNLQDLNLADNPSLGADFQLGDFPRSLVSVNISCTNASSIPPALSLCKSLTSLTASRNTLTSIPTWISRLKNLKRIDLSSNNISVISQRLFKRKLLWENINLADNPLDFADFFSLKIHMASHLNLSGGYVSTLSIETNPSLAIDLQRITSLDLSRNHLTSLPSSITLLENIIHFDVMQNSISSIPNQIFRLCKLESFNISQNKMASLPNEMGYLISLRSLYLSSNILSDLPQSFSNLVNLAVLHLHGNQITMLPSFWAQFTDMIELTLHENQISWLPSSFSCLSALKCLWLTRNPLDHIPAVLSLTNLTTLHCNEAKLGSISFSIPQGYPLRQLLLSNNNITVLPPSISLLNHLSYLDVSRNHLSRLPQELGSIGQLEYLNCAGNQISLLEFSFDTLENLKFLLLGNSRQGNNLETLPSSITSCSSLQILDCSKNKLTALPTHLGLCASIQELILDGNQLTSLPLSVSLLSDLTTLSLSGNPVPLATQRVYLSLTKREQNHLNLSQLDGAIEIEHIQSAHQLLDIVTLDLSSNRLNELPLWIGSLTNLKHLVLDYNLLSVLPPWVCSLRLQTLSLRGMPLMSSQVVEAYGSIIPDRKINSLEKTLKILEVLRKVESPMDKVFQTYEDYACQLLETTTKSFATNGETYDAPLTIIEQACKSSASKFLSHIEMKTSVWRRWTNYADPRRYLRKKYNRSNWWSDGIRSGFIHIADAYMHEFYPFLLSPLAKYVCSITTFILYLLVVVSIIRSSNESLSSSVFENSMGLKSKLEPQHVNTTKDYWNYLETVFVPLAYSPNPFSSPSNSLYSDWGSAYHRRQSPVIQRQLRSTKKNCLHHYRMAPSWILSDDPNSTMQYCIPPYSSHSEDYDSFGSHDQYKWTSYNPIHLGDLHGQFGASYPASGFLVDMGDNISQALDVVQELKSSEWVDTQTRVIVLEYVVSNQNLRIISQVQVLFEFLATGVVYSTISVTSAPIPCILPKYSTLLSSYIILGMFFIAFVAHEVSKHNRMNRRYWHMKWNYLDVSIICLLLMVLVNQMLIFVSSPSIIIGPDETGQYDRKPTEGDFGVPFKYFFIQKQLLAILVLFSFTKFFYYTRLHHVIGPLQIRVWEVLVRSLRFIYVVAIFYAAFGLSCYSIFGANLAQFSTLYRSFHSLGQITFLQFDFLDVLEFDSFVGTILVIFSMFVFGIFFTSMIISGIVGSYSDLYETARTKHCLLVASATIEMMDYPVPVPFNLMSSTWSIIKATLVPLLNPISDPIEQETTFEFDVLDTSALSLLPSASAISYRATPDGLCLSSLCDSSLVVTGRQKWSRKDKFRYFEIEILQPGQIFVGLVSNNKVQDARLGRDADMICFGGLGISAVWIGSLCDVIGDEVIAAGTVLGCGVDYERNYIFFTYNGVMLSRRFGLFNEVAVPMVRLDSNGSCIRANFGHHAFVANPRHLRMIRTSALAKALTISRPRQGVLFEAPHSTDLWISSRDGFVSYVGHEDAESCAAGPITAVVVQSALIVQKQTVQNEQQTLPYLPFHSCEALVLHPAHKADIAIGLCDSAFPRDHILGHAEHSLGWTLSLVSRTITISSFVEGEQQTTNIQLPQDISDIYSVCLDIKVGAQLTSLAANEAELCISVNGVCIDESSTRVMIETLSRMRPAVTLFTRPQCIVFSVAAYELKESFPTQSLPSTPSRSSLFLQSSLSSPSVYASQSRSTANRPSSEKRFGRDGVSRASMISRLSSAVSPLVMHTPPDDFRSDSLVDNEAHRTQIRMRRRMRTSLG